MLVHRRSPVLFYSAHIVIDRHQHTTCYWHAYATLPSAPLCDKSQHTAHVMGPSPNTNQNRSPVSYPHSCPCLPQLRHYLSRDLLPCVESTADGIPFWVPFRRTPELFLPACVCKSREISHYVKSHVLGARVLLRGCAFVQKSLWLVTDFRTWRGKKRLMHGYIC